MRIEEPGTADSRRKAIVKYQEAIPLWQAANDLAHEARTLALIATAYVNLGEKQNAFDFVNRALPLSENAIKECVEEQRPAAIGVKAYVLDTMGRAYQDFGDRKKARELYNNALSLSQSIGDRVGELNSLINLGKASILLADYPKALELSERALQMVNELGERSKETVVLNNMCLVHQSTGAFEKAFELCNQAVSTARDTNNRWSEANAIQNLGSTYYRTGDYQKAIDAVSYFQVSDYRKSLEMHLEVLPLRERLNETEGKAVTIENIAQCYDRLGEKQKALDYHEWK